jgi:hypothetical protein
MGEWKEVFRGVPTRSDIETGIKRVVHIIIIIKATGHVCFNTEVTVETGKGNILVCCPGCIVSGTWDELETESQKRSEVFRRVYFRRKVVEGHVGWAVEIGPW